MDLIYLILQFFSSQHLVF